MKKNILAMILGWWKIALAVVTAAVGLILVVFGNEQRNAIIIALGCALLGGGILLIVGKSGTLGTRILPRQKELKEAANVLIIYPKDIEFDYIQDPPGYQQRCITDRRWYSVLIKKPEGELEEFTLPDVTEKTRHFDPHEFRNVVFMPANKQLFERTRSLVKTVAVGIMGVAVCLLGIVIIAMGG